MYLFIFACTESALLCTGFLELRQAGNALLIAVGGLLCCGAQSLGLVGSVVGVHGLSCPLSCGILPDRH